MVGLPASTLSHLQRVQQLGVFLASINNPTSLALQQLHWLPVIGYQLSVIAELHLVRSNTVLSRR